MGKHIPYKREVFIERLRALRKEKGFTQEELGQKLENTKGAIGHWEAGTREPPLGKVYELAKLFSVSVDYMLGTSDFRNENEAIDYMLLKLREAGLVEDDTLDKDDIDKLMGYIKAIEKIKKDAKQANYEYE